MEIPSFKQAEHLSSARQEHAAVFVDFENMFFELRKTCANDEDLSISDLIVSMVRGLKEHFLKHHKNIIIIKAYADFENIFEQTAEDYPQRSLFLVGVETMNVMGTEHKNAADMRLCIDVLETMHTRNEIENFVLVAGDRDYIPVVQHLRRHGKRVYVASFRSNVSGDLMQNIDPDKFIDAMTLLSPEEVRRIGLSKSKRLKVQVGTAIQNNKPKDATPALLAMQDPGARSILKILLADFGRYPEIYLVPFLQRINVKMPRLANYEIKSLISACTSHGTIQIVKKPGKTNSGEDREYSVIHINYNHPTVRELSAEVD